MTCIISKLNHICIFLRREIHEIIIHRVLRFTFKTHFIMKVWTGGFPCRPYSSDQLPAFHLITLFDQNFT